MKIRRFFAPDMRRAIQLVRTEHGADAVILSSRAVDGGMEIISAVDYDEELIAHMIQPSARAKDGAADERSSDAAAGADAAAPEAHDATSGEPVFDLSRAASDADRGHGGERSGGREARRKQSAGHVGKDETADAQAHVPAASRPSAKPAEARRSPAAEDRAAPDASRSASSAAAAEQAEPARREAAPDRGATEHAEHSNANERAAKEGAAGMHGGDNASIAALRNELTAMRSMLCRQLAQLHWADRRMLEPERALLASRVARLGLDPVLANELVAEIEDPGNDRAWREVMYGLARRLDVPNDDPLDEGGVFALVGPTGVGKTTTIAKLAARHCLRHGRESLALISTDTLRIGAQRQLDAYGAILGVPVRQASGAAELKQLLGALADRRLVLIDTAGLSVRDRRLGDALGQLDADRRVRRLVVLAATMQPGVMDEAVGAFGGDQLSGAVLTKLDETDSLGPALSVLIRRKLTATWLSHGQRVPEDLRLARIIHLLRWALDEPRPEVTDDPVQAAMLPIAAAAAEVMHAGV